jgi:hypothetical protein
MLLISLLQQLPGVPWDWQQRLRSLPDKSEIQGDEEISLIPSCKVRKNNGNRRTGKNTVCIPRLIRQLH